VGFGFIRHERNKEPGQADSLRAEIVPDQRLAGARAVALIEDEVDDREDSRQPLRQFRAAGHPVRNPGVPDFRLRPDQPLGHGCFGNHKGPGDLSGGQSA
jgi:hypothetical protein